ncbi:carbohydrate-binding module family 18 protein [Piromyces sp. E2]|nr:carbohydrate-binding module family 18 protein [Piromyces sp. E2]|eukprot:OUM62257.1 carbohydrate-binding module family 18 protein [Piromyces sp. E2]
MKNKLIYSSSKEQTTKTAEAFEPLISLKSLAKNFRDITNISFSNPNNNNHIPSTSKPKVTTTNKKFPISRDRCESNVVVCIENLCCSKYSWLDKTKHHYGSGCQSQYSICD